ncbi:MAG: ATP-dependent helicase HrpB [Kiritimatiellae bacterium]|nr:ATP-dependent helicase HrpB [Kiritimatiellia bacterium]
MRSRDLPIFELESAVEAAVRAGRRFILRAPTGSGKSTQVPQFILDRGGMDSGQVVVLQPRRIAARMLAARVAAERGSELGGEVGYQIRFESRCRRDTRIRFVTEGLLLRQMQSDPELSGVHTILFDEFHERHLYGDLTLALAIRLQETCRPDLRIGVMSATLGIEALEAQLNPCVTLKGEGRKYPVDIQYLARTPTERERPWDLAADALERMDPGERAAGHVLVFMPGAYEIRRTIAALQERPAARGFVVCALHGELPAAEQDAAVAPSSRPKIIVATNVAETSLTIDGVRTVIDSGLARIASYDPHRGINTLRIERISRASADQRAGRAGRTGPGVCHRLWTERDQHARALEEIPEIRRVDLSESSLMLRTIGVRDPAELKWLEPPDPRALERAERLLMDLGAISTEGELTDTGRRMAAFPLHPRYSRMLIEAGQRGAVRTVALCAALTQGRGILIRRVGRGIEDAREDQLGPANSDFFALIRAWNHARRCGYRTEECARLGIHAQAARAVEPVYDLFLRIAQAQDLPLDDTPPEDVEVAKCILAGFADQVARRLDGGTLRCTVVHQRRGRLDSGSAVRDATLLVAAEVAEIQGKELEVVLSLATRIEPEWLMELFPQSMMDQVAVRYHPVEHRVIAERVRGYHDLALETRRESDVPPDAAAALLAGLVLAGDVHLRAWDDTVERYLRRINLLAGHAPELGIPAVGPEERRLLLEQICLGSFSQRDLRDLEVWNHIRGWLTPAQQAALDREMPERMELPNGYRARVVYPEQGPPRFSARIQDLYGVRALPRLARGRLSPALEILAPNQRPVQITQDLEGFWANVYPSLRPEYARRYPKHEWREPGDVDGPPAARPSRPPRRSASSA